MKISPFLKDVLAARLNITGTALATTAVAMSLLFGAIPAQAMTVERDGDNVSAIRDLEIGGVVYDVKFCSATSARTYDDPPTFDFPIKDDALAAAEAVRDVLNAEGGVATVGTVGDSNCPGQPAAGNIFRVGFAVESVDIPIIDRDVRFTKVWEAVTDDQAGGVWVIPTDAEGNKVSDVFPFLDDGLFADFTEVGAPGSGNRPPTAEAGEPVVGIVGAAVNFDGRASSDPDDSIVSWDWDFGDGNTGSGETTSHTYQSDSTYNVILTVTDNGGLTDSDSTTAVIGSLSEPPTADAGGPYQGVPGVPVQFNSSDSSDDGGIVTYIWIFGDGNSSSVANPIHTYQDPGTYPVRLTVEDGDLQSAEDSTEVIIAAGNAPPTADAGLPATGNVGAPVSFNGSSSSDLDGTIVSWDWDFGDGNSGSGETTSHTYAAPCDCTVTLVVTDNGVPPAQDSDVTAASIGSALMDPLADADGPYAGTSGVPIQFNSDGSNDDGEIVAWSWDFGDGESSNQANPIHIYQNAGNYSVTLTVIDDDSLSDQDTTEAAVADGNQPPSADPGGAYPGVAGVAILFDGTVSDDPDGTIVQYDWDFGDGSTGTGETTSHTYVAAGEYPVLLTVTDNDGATDTEDTAANIYASNQSPVADANGPYTGSVNAAVSFDGSGSTDADGTIDSWNWDFGDGNTGTGETTSHTYTALGNYSVTLRVTDNDGATSAEAFSTADIDSPNTSPVADANGPYVGKVGVPVDFDGSGSTDADGTIVQYDWNFDDTNTGTGETTSHTYMATGVYDVVLTVTDNDGATANSPTQAIIGDGVNLQPTADPGGPYFGNEGVAVNFDGSDSDDPDGTIAQYDWDFGDGNTDTGVTPSNTYAAADNYLVTLTVTDDGGRTDTRTTVAAIGMGNQAPTSDAGGPYAGAVDAPVQFNGTGSDDADGYLVSAQWDFGDGGKGSGLIPTHTYTGAGPYTATLIVTDSDGATDQSSATVVISDGVSLPPTADANGPYTGVAGAAVTFDGTNSSDLDGNVAAWDWTFGDGMTGTGPTPDNTYLAGSIYNVILQVTDDDGLIASDGTTASIGEFSQPPTADANGPYTGSVNAAVNFDGSGSTDADGAIASWNWNFGDGNTDTGATPSNTYAAAGRYIVELTVTDDSGETDTDITVATIGTGNLPPTADAGDAVSGIVRRDITFDGTGSSDPDGTIDLYEWAFGDGNTGTGPTPTHNYADVGTYFVALTVTDSDGVTSSDVTVADVTPVVGGGSSGGCSIGNNEVKDPTLPLLVLLSVIYVIRRRLGHLYGKFGIFLKNNLHGGKL